MAGVHARNINREVFSIQKVCKTMYFIASARERFCAKKRHGKRSPWTL
jgi:hypothetical protein